MFQTDSMTATQLSALLDDDVPNPHLQRTLLVTQGQEKPVFLMKPVISSECAALKTDSCGMMDPNANCSQADWGFWADCNSAPNFEVAIFLSMIAQLNASHGLALNLHGTRNFPAGVFAPVKDVLVALHIWDFSGIKLSSFRSAEGNFPVMQHLLLGRCSDIEIQRTDLRVFPALRVFDLWSGSTLRSIEPGAFDELPYLRHITFEKGFDTSKPLPQTALNHLRLLHCDPQNTWLRVFLRERPYLIAPNAEGEIYGVGGIVNKAIFKEDTFIPVDCSLKRLVKDAWFPNFSSLDE